MTDTQSIFTNTPADHAAPTSIHTSAASHQPPGPLRPRQLGPVLVKAAQDLLPIIESGQRINKVILKDILTDRLAGSDATHAWSWKHAWDTAEAAIVLFLLRWSASLLQNNTDPARLLRQLHALERLEPTQTYRSEQQIRLQQFSTTLPLAYLVSSAAMIRPDDIVLEPSAGTGLLATFALPHLQHTTQLWLNEIDDLRHTMLAALFPDAHLSQHNAEQIRDRLPACRPTVVIMNPPFSHHLHQPNTRQRTDMLHIQAALKSLGHNGRLVAITAASCTPLTPAWHTLFSDKPPLSIPLSIPISGRLYRKHGTEYDLRLTVIDNHAPSANHHILPGDNPLSDTHDILALLNNLIPDRPEPSHAPDKQPGTISASPGTPQHKAAHRHTPAIDNIDNAWGEIIPLAYHVNDLPPATTHTLAGDNNYIPWEPTGILIDNAPDHPTKLMQTAAMSAVRHPPVTHIPKLPRKTLDSKALSNAQLETVILAGDAHNKTLNQPMRISADYLDTRNAAPADTDTGPLVSEEQAWSSVTTLRRGFFLGDDTGTGKGRQVAAIIIDNILQGRTRAIWLSESENLIQDARRDWSDLGGNPDYIFPVNRFKLGQSIARPTGIAFCTYATLRTRKPGKPSRLDMIVEWLAGGPEETHRHRFDGIIAFDESHALCNAMSSKGNRGNTKPSAQGLAGLALQNALPDARVLYVSATGANRLEGLAYASRLGLWNAANTDFTNRNDFIQSLEKGGIAALEILARDLKSLGLYQARIMSYDGVEIDTVVHTITDQQRDTYNEYAEAFKIIHHNLEDALKATNITDSHNNSLNKNARSAARSTFESTKQRFFCHLLTSMKCPTLIRRIEADIADNKSPIVQLISTGEAMLERRIADIPMSERQDLNLDMSPREYLLEYLKHAFPVHLYEVRTDSDGNQHSVLATDQHNNPITSQEAVELRQQLMERLCSPPPVNTALDQIIQHFGTDTVAEITGRKRRVVKHNDPDGPRFALQSRPANANLSETRAFMSGLKHILVFSQAGGTGRSYHADTHCGNTRRRHHYLLEAGWRAERAIQGLGRSHRTNQAHSPRFIPLTTDVKGERRFISTIARRLGALGAITRGQRNAQTTLSNADQQLFNERDNFESDFARQALRQFYADLYKNSIPGWSVEQLQNATGLKLLNENALKKDLPPMHQFLNRILALPIAEQNSLFTELEIRIDKNIEDAIEGGTYDAGIEYIKADSPTILNRHTIYQHDKTNATSEIIELKHVNQTHILDIPAALAKAKELLPDHETRAQKMIINRSSGYAALLIPGPLTMLRLIRPNSNTLTTADDHGHSQWAETTNTTQWESAWQKHINDLPKEQETRLWMVTGLLLPIWKKLPSDSIKVYRLITDDNIHLIGRVFTTIQAHAICKDFNIGQQLPALGHNTVWSLLTRNRHSFSLKPSWRLQHRLVAGAPRVEIENCTYTDLQTFKQLGCKTEIIAHKTRCFIPNEHTLATIMNRYTVTPIVPAAPQ